MARKDILKGLLDPQAAAAPTPPAPPASPAVAPAVPGSPRANRGAIGAVSRSIADLKARAVVDLDPGLIEAGGMADRLEGDAADDALLQQSIAEYGQQVPVLVRPHPEAEGRYQIVYGRRRLLALRALGQPVKALIRALDDRALVLAQGQENSARRDLSFIEKVNFARQLRDAGYDRKVIGDALSVDKTLISRMLSVADRLPEALIAGIGAAPSVGRERWLALADLVQARGIETDVLLAAVVQSARSDHSDDRFQAAWDHLTRAEAAPRAAPENAIPPSASAPEAPAADIRILTAPDGQPIAEARYDRRFCTLRLRREESAGFDDWLVTHLARLHAAWKAEQEA